MVEMLHGVFLPLSPSDVFGVYIANLGRYLGTVKWWDHTAGEVVGHNHGTSRASGTHSVQPCFARPKANTVLAPYSVQILASCSFCKSDM